MPNVLSYIFQLTIFFFYLSMFEISFESANIFFDSTPKKSLTLKPWLRIKHNIEFIETQKNKNFLIGMHFSILN